MPEELRKRCEQPFHFLGMGAQSIAFESEDGTLVLKFFKRLLPTRKVWLSFPLIRQLKREELAAREEGWRLRFRAHEIAETYLKEESGLLFFHPEKCNCCLITTLIDPLGSPHQLNLSDYGFILQKKAEGSVSFLLNCVKNGELEKANRALLSIAALLKKTKNLGIYNRDPRITTNIGILDGEAMLIDIGSLKKDELAAETTVKIWRAFGELIPLMEKEAPCLVPMVKEAMESMEIECLDQELSYYPNRWKKHRWPTL